MNPSPALDQREQDMLRAIYAGIALHAILLAANFPRGNLTPHPLSAAGAAEMAREYADAMVKEFANGER